MKVYWAVKKKRPYVHGTINMQMTRKFYTNCKYFLRHFFYKRTPDINTPHIHHGTTTVNIAPAQEKTFLGIQFARTHSPTSQQCELCP
jgi:hypothetical protein